MIDSTEFENLKRNLSGKDPLLKRVRLSEITLTTDSIKKNTILVNGTPVKVARNFFMRLAQVVNLNTSLMNRMEKHDDIAIQIKLLEAVKAYAETRDGNTEFFLIGDQEKHELVNIVRADRYSRLTNDTLFDTAGILLNKVSDLYVQSVDLREGDFNINLVHTKDAGFERLGPDEVFRFGISLVNSQNKSEIKDFMYRRSCANGMISRNDIDPDGGDGGTPTRFGGPKRLGGGGTSLSGPDSFRAILEKAQFWSKGGFMPSGFKDRLELAMNTPSSLAEMNRAFSKVEQELREEDPDRKFWLVKTAKAQLFPALEEAERRLISKGYDPTILTLDQMKFVKTARSIWELVNDLTWIGSHKSTFDMRSSNQFKFEGGNLFTKEWDLKHAALAGV